MKNYIKPEVIIEDIIIDDVICISSTEEAFKTGFLDEDFSNL